MGNRSIKLEKQLNIDRELAKSADDFKREIRLAGFNDEEVGRIIKLVEKQPMWMLNVVNTTVTNKDGVVVVCPSDKRDGSIT